MTYNPALGHMQMRSPLPEYTQIMDMSDLAQRWGISLKSVHRMRSREGALPLPTHVLGSSPGWTVARVMEWEQAHPEVMAARARRQRAGAVR